MDIIRNAFMHYVIECCYNYFRGYMISANRMAPKNSTELLDSIRIKNRSIKVKLEMFFLFVTLCNQNHE